MNGGKNWILAGGNLPRVRVDDIVINVKNNDLILGTHGRGIVILDDISMLENLNQKCPRLRGLPLPSARGDALF